MRVTALGHSSFLLEIEGAAGRTVRILGDPWLSDHVVGDLMGRAPRVSIDWQRLPALDAIFLSHSHTDHLDPYSLLELWRRLDPQPQVLLPQSLAYLVPLLTEFLPGAQCAILVENEPLELLGLRLRGLFNVEQTGTNEDDVMMLLVESDTELFLAEADAVFPYGDPDARALMHSLLDAPDLEVAVFHTIKNELGALMSSVHAENRSERDELVDEAREHTRAEIEDTFARLPDLDEDLWDDPRVTRLLGGQGICFPQDIDPLWNRVLFPIPLEVRADWERAAAAEHERAVQIAAFLPGQTYVPRAGAAPEVQACEFLELRDPPEDFRYDPTIPRFEDFPVAPLRPRAIDEAALEPRLLEILNGRFLPWLIGRRAPPIEHLLSHHGGEYRVRVRYGDPARPRPRDYCISFDALRFQVADASGPAPEEYWAADLADYLEGRADDFSTFCRRAPGGEARHLWDCLGMPYLNNDLVEKKLRLHFERARRGESLAEFVLAAYRA